MFNKGGISTDTFGSVTQILGNTKFIGLSVIVDNTAKDASGMCLAGTPLKGDFLSRDGGAGAFVEAAAGSETTPSDANCVLLHDIEFDGSNDANATVVTKGTIQLKYLDASVAAKYTEQVIEALAAHGIDVINSPLGE